MEGIEGMEGKDGSDGKDGPLGKRGRDVEGREEGDCCVSRPEMVRCSSNPPERSSVEMDDERWRCRGGRVAARMGVPPADDSYAKSESMSTLGRDLFAGEPAALGKAKSLTLPRVPDASLASLSRDAWR